MLILFRIFLKLLSSKTLIFTVKIMKDEQNLLFIIFKSFADSFLIEETNRKETSCKCRRIINVLYRRI